MGPTERSVREHIKAGGVMVQASEVALLLEIIDSLRSVDVRALDEAEAEAERLRAGVEALAKRAELQAHAAEDARALFDELLVVAACLRALLTREGT